MKKMLYQLFMKDLSFGKVMKRGEIVTSKYFPKGYTFIVHRTYKSDGYAVSSVEAGRRIESGRTKEEAIKNAIDRCSKHSKSLMIRKIKEQALLFEQYKKDLDQFLEATSKEAKK
jgi:hypothetical protein